VNDGRPFNTGDFEALLNIGNGHKRSHAAAIGQYGVGFCSGYSVTDTPHRARRPGHGGPSCTLEGGGVGLIFRPPTQAILGNERG